jgi:hypothetical protein
MNGYVSSHLQGGLGNYLFQISAAYAVSLKHNKELKIDTSDIAIIHSPLELYSNNIFRNIQFGNIDEFRLIHHSGHSPISYLEIPVIEGNLKLDGYYQNEMYFKEYRNEILNLFEIDETTSVESRQAAFLKAIESLGNTANQHDAAMDSANNTK